jgi:hypothetical protein
MLADARGRYPLVTHGLSLGLGDREAPPRDFLRALRAFLEAVGSPWHRDHLCFGAVDGAHLHDLLPLPFTEASIRAVVDRVALLEDALGLPIAVENISWYAHPGDAAMGEADFLQEITRRSGARLLLDVHNAYVNARNEAALGHAPDAGLAVHDHRVGEAVHRHVVELPPEDLAVEALQGGQVGGHDLAPDEGSGHASKLAQTSPPLPRAPLHEWRGAPGRAAFHDGLSGDRSPSPFMERGARQRG